MELEESLYLVQSCDIWRDYKTFRNVGVFTEEGFYDFLKNDKNNDIGWVLNDGDTEITHIDDLIELKMLDIDNFLEQKIDFINVIKVEINEEM